MNLTGTEKSTESIVEQVRDRYGRIAVGEAAGCGCGCGPAGGEEKISGAIGYGADELAALPADANLGLGCGAPIGHLELAAGETVADLGSGLGDFAGFLTSRGHPVKPGPGPAVARTAGSTVWYNGYDVTPSMVQAARQKHPFGSFHHRDVLEQGFVGSPDYVIASGTFNIRLRDHEAWFKVMITAMYGACRLATRFATCASCSGPSDLRISWSTIETN